MIALTLIGDSIHKSGGWASELGAAEVVLVFAPVVLAELDRHQFAGSRREKKRARAVVRALDDLDVGVEPVPVRTGVRAMGLPHEPDGATFAEWRLSPEAQDDQLLASLLSFRAGIGSGHRVLVVTADTGIRRTKARPRNIEAIKPHDRLRSPDEPDEVEKELEAATRELAAIKNAAPDLAVTIAGKKVIEYSFATVPPFRNEERTRLVQEWRKRNPHITAPGAIEIPGMGRFESALAGLTGPTQAEADAHNADIEAAFKRFETYLGTWRNWVASNLRTVRFDFVLGNSGTAPAEDVDLVVWTEAKGVWRAKRPKPPKRPEGPTWRSRFDLSYSPTLARLPVIDAIRNFRDSAAEIEGPDIDVDDPTSAEFKIRRVKHLVPCVLPVVFFQFDNDEDVKSFGIDFTLGAANMRDRKTGSVHVKVIPGEPRELPEPLEHDDSWPDEFDDGDDED